MHKRGDTLIEVMFAVAIFGMAAIGTIALMNRGLASTQNSLETTMARQEIDAQAEALRFLHSAYISEPKKANPTPIDQVCANPSSYRDLWKCLTSSTYMYPSAATNQTQSVIGQDPNFFSRTIESGQVCNDIFNADPGSSSFSLRTTKSFVINPRSLDISGLDTTGDITQVLQKAIVANDPQHIHLDLAATHPRLLYQGASDNLSDATVTSGQLVYGDNRKVLEKSEGIWVTGIASPSGVQCKKENSAETEFRPDYYDFHIQTCWDATTNNTASTIESTVRLFNPDQISLVNKSSQLKLEDMALFFVMTWTGGNSDIDAHLKGSKDREVDGQPFHIYYGHKTAGEEREYSFITQNSGRAYTFQLDVDAISAMNYCESDDRWCGNGHGNGNVEVIAFRSLFPATFDYIIQDYAQGGLNNQNLKVRVFVGQADSGEGQWPRDTEPVATFTYSHDGSSVDCGGLAGASSGKCWNVASFEVKSDGTFIIGGHSLSLTQAAPEVATVTSEGTCERVSAP